MPKGVDTALYRSHPKCREDVGAGLGIDETAPLVGMIARYHPMNDPINLLKAMPINCPMFGL